MVAGWGDRRPPRSVGRGRRGRPENETGCPAVPYLSDRAGDLIGGRQRWETAMWNSFRTDQPLGLSAEITTVSGGNGDTVHAYVARPTTPGPHPGIVAVHH